MTPLLIITLTVTITVSLVYVDTLCVDGDGSQSSGIRLGASSNTFTNNTITASYCGVDITGIDNAFTDITFNSTYPTKVNFSYQGDIKIKAVENPPQDPNGWTNIGKYLNITNSTNAWVFVNFTYEDKENSLIVFKHDGTSWQKEGWNGTRVLDTVNNIVGVNITNIGSVFVPLQDITPPSVTGHNSGKHNLLNLYAGNKHLSYR